MEAEVEAESHIHELERRVEELEKLREADQAELTALKESEQNAVTELENLKEENSKLQEESREAKESSKIAKQVKERTDAEKRDLLDALARSDGDKQRLEESLAELRSAHSSTLASLRSMEASYSSATENERSYKLRLQGLEGELTVLKKDRDWNHEELLRVTEESTKDRREKNGQISSLQNQLDSAVQSSESASASLAALRASHATLEGRLLEAQARISNLSTELADSEASFRSEIATVQRLNDLLERREEDTKKRLDEVEQEWTAARNEMEELKVNYEDELAKERSRADALETRVNEMRSMADQLVANGSSTSRFGEPSIALPSSITLNGSDDVFGSTSMAPASPSATGLSFRVQKSGGLSYTDMYTTYIKMEEALGFEKAESKRLSECLNEILAEISDRAPMLREQRDEYERAVTENNDLSVALAQALEERESLAQLAEARQNQLEERAREAIISSQQLEDTSRQVRTLARQIAILEDPSILERGAPPAEDALPAGNGDAENADAYISQHLVTFTTIDQLQRQNQNLLKITRELGKKMEAEEQAVRDRVGRAEHTAVEEAHDLIVRLKEEVESQRAQMGSYQRERDMLRQVLKNRGQEITQNGDDSHMQTSTSANKNVAQAAFDDLQQNFEAYKREMVIDNQALREDLASARKEVSHLHIEVARAKAEREYASERVKTLQDANTRVELEMTQMSKRNSELQINMARQDDATRRVSEEVVELKSSLDRARHETMMLKAEKEVWKNVEARLTEDNATLAKERGHMSDLMRNLQSMHNELDRTGNEARQRLEETLTRTSKDLEITKERLIQETENARQMSLRRELESRELQEKLDKATHDYHEAREAYIGSKNAAERATDRVEALQRQLAAYEEKLAVYEGRRTQTSEGASSLSREQQLETQVADIRAELSTAKVEADQARGHVEQYKAIAQGHENALAELNKTYDEYKQSMDAIIAQKDHDMQALQERVQSLTAELTSSSDENSQLHRQLQAQKAQFAEEQQSNMSTIETLRHFEVEITALRDSSKRDLEAQIRRANEAHDRYQAEVVAHAEDVKSLTNARQQLATVQSALLEATSKLETAEANLASSNDSWSSQRENLQKEINEQKQRCDELIQQNAILHDHLENVSNQAAMIKQVAEGQATTDGEELSAPPSEAKTSDELHAVIRYVRRERDVAELRLELSRQQESRMRQQLEHAHKQLDEKTSELAQERQKASENAASVAQHAELMAKIQSLNLLRESNETLRRENEEYVERLRRLETRLRETELELSPLREKVRLLEADVEARDRNIALLEEDNARWKTRTQQILQKYERIDPAELASLKEELASVKAALEEAQKQRDAEKTRAEAIQTDLQDANTRAEANQGRFKSLQRVAREHRDSHQAAQAESERKIAALQSELDELKASFATAESQLKAAQDSSSSALSAETQKLNTIQAQKEELERQLNAVKATSSTNDEEAQKRKEEQDSAHKKLEEDMALQMRRNAQLLADNKKFRAQIQELTTKASQTLEEEVQKRLAASAAEGGDKPAGPSEEALRSQLAELEQRLTQERTAAVTSAVSETESRLKTQFEAEKAQLSAQLSAQVVEGGQVDPASLQQRIDEAAAAKIQEAIQAKDAESKAATAEEIKKVIAEKDAQINTLKQNSEAARKQLEANAQALNKQQKAAIEKLQKEHAEQLSKAVEEAKASAGSQEAGEITSSGISQEEADKAVQDALAKKEEEHQKLLATKIAEIEKKEKQQFELKNKLRESQIQALRREVTSLKARLQPPNAGETSSTPATATPAAALPTDSPPSVANGAPRGLSIAGRSQSQPAVAKPATPIPGGGLSIAGSAAAANASTEGSAAVSTPAATATRGRGRGRGQIRGAAVGAGRGRGAIVGSALNAVADAVADAGAKRAREEENTDGDAKRRKDGEAQ